MASKKIPDFETLDEASRFWDTHSFADYAADTEEVEITVGLPSGSDRLQIELAEPLARQLQNLARRKHTTPSHLIEQWIKQQLSEEEQAA